MRFVVVLSVGPPWGSASPGGSARPGRPVGERMQAFEHHQSANINVKNFLSMIGISVFTLIRTDTTLDLSQKAEKVCL